MWLLIGGDSEIGAATHQHLKAHGIPCAATTRRKDCVGPDRPFLDLATPLDDWEPPAGTTAVVVFIAIARITACDADPQGSAYINVTQTLALIDRLRKRGILVLFLSTNQVFDGSVPNVAPDASPCPVTEYGRQKARTEDALLSRMGEGAPIAILRLAKVVAPDMPLLRNWIDSLGRGQPIRAFRDMTMAPAETTTVAQAITALLKDSAGGIFQLTGPRDLSYFEIGLHLAAKLGADSALITGSTATAAGLPAGSARPFTTLASSQLRETYGIAAPDVLEIVDSIVQKKDSGSDRLGRVSKT
jgi:dTDP-4-dehydrorhamnose reductase